VWDQFQRLEMSHASQTLVEMEKMVYAWVGGLQLEPCAL
jgi:hypothetical protein